MQLWSRSGGVPLQARTHLPGGSSSQGAPTVGLALASQWQSGPGSSKNTGVPWAGSLMEASNYFQNSDRLDPQVCHLTDGPT